MLELWLAVGGVLIGIPGLIALWYQRRRNTLDYRVTVATKLLSPNIGDTGFGLEVSSQGVKLLEPFLLQVRVENTGRQAIQADDYVDAITVTPNTQAVGMTVVDESPDGVIDPGAVAAVPDPTNKGFNEGWVFRPRLLNPRDWFEVQMLCEGSPTLGVSARWANQTRSMRRMIVRKRNDLSVIWFLAVFSLAASFSFGLALAFFLKIFMQDETAAFVSSIAWIIAVLVIIYVTARETWRWHRGRY